MKQFRFFFRLLIYGNFFIALCASLLTAESYIILQKRPDFSILALVFLSTFSLYNLQRLILIEGGRKGSERQSFILENKKLLWILTSASIVTGTYFFFAELNWQQAVIFISTGIVSLAYFLPFTGLRELPLLKAVLVALCWASTTFLLPWQWKGDESHSCFFFLEKFFFVFSIAIVFDIRDIIGDRSSGTRSIPVLAGIKAAKIISVLSLVASAILLYTEGLFAVPLIIVYATTGLLVLGSNERRDEYYYSLIADGMIGVRALTVLLLAQNSSL